MKEGVSMRTYCRKESSKIGVLVVITVLLLSMIRVTAMNVQAVETNDEAMCSISLVDFNNAEQMTGLVGEASVNHTLNGNTYSIHWDEHIAYQDLEIELGTGIPTDWSGYDCVNMQIYSEKATGATIKLLAVSPATSNGYSYYQCAQNITVDWTGWKEFTIYFRDMAAVRDATWTNINMFRLCAGGGWGITAMLRLISILALLILSSWIRMK